MGMPTLTGKKLSIYLFPHWSHLFYVSTENGRPNPSEMDIKVFIAAPTFRLQTKKVYSQSWNFLNNSSVRKYKIKKQNEWVLY